MVDANLRGLLEEVVNTSGKLAIVLLFAQQQRLSTTPKQMSRRVYRDIWSVEKALHELAEDGILVHADGQYTYQPIPELHESLGQLLDCYDEPLCRPELMQIVGDLERYAPYRDVLENQRVTVLSR